MQRLTYFLNVYLTGAPVGVAALLLLLLKNEGGGGGSHHSLKEVR